MFPLMDNFSLRKKLFDLLKADMYKYMTGKGPALIVTFFLIQCNKDKRYMTQT